MSQILSDLREVADAGPRNGFMLDRVAQRLKVKLNLSDSLASIERAIRAECRVTSSPSGDVLQGWALKK